MPILRIKMDIEGFEYVVLPDLIHSNAICNFDFIFGEVHQCFAPITWFHTDKSNPQMVLLNTGEEAKSCDWALTKVIKASWHCNFSGLKAMMNPIYMLAKHGLIISTVTECR